MSEASCNLKKGAVPDVGCRSKGECFFFVFYRVENIVWVFCFLDGTPLLLVFKGNQKENHHFRSRSKSHTH